MTYHADPERGCGLLLLAVVILTALVLVAVFR